MSRYRGQPGGTSVIEQALGPPTHTVAEVGAPKAAKLYKMWHQKEPDSAYVQTFAFPEYICAVGRAHTIAYLSDKWMPNGNGREYEHYFDTHPTVYAPMDCSLFQPTADVVETASILRADIDGDVQLPLLALVLEFIVIQPDHRKKNFVFKTHQPVLCSTHDAKGLVIFAQDRGRMIPLFVRGGKMYVNSHGIIK